MKHHHVSIYSRGCWMCRLADWFFELDWKVVKVQRSLRKFFMGGGS